MKFNIFWVGIVLLLVNTLEKMNFERNIFVFWATPMQGAPLIVRCSYQKLQIAAERDGWELHLISEANIKDYLPDYNRFQDVVSKGYRQTIEEKSDILRIYLIEQHGGVWLDFSLILMQGLDWLTDEQSFDHLIINKVGKNLNDPEMLMIGQSTHLSPYSYYNTDNRLISEEYFGHAIHFIASKRKSRIMTSWKRKYDDLVTKNYTQMMPGIMNNRIFVQNIYWPGVYVSANIAFETVIQQRQHQLDDRISLWNMFSKRQNVYQNLKIWQMHGQVGPTALSRHHLIYFGHLFSKTKQEVEQKLGKLWFYVKMNHIIRKQVINRQQYTEKYFRKHPNLTIETIIRTGPTLEECRLFYIVKGSILHMLYEGSKYINEIKAPFITVEQRQMLRRYCADKNPEYYKLEYEPNFPPYGQETKPEREIKYYNMTSMWQKISLIPIVYHKELDIFRWKWYEAYGAMVTYLFFRNAIVLAKFIFNLIRKRILNRKEEPIFPLQQIKRFMSVEYFKEKFIEKSTKENIMSLLKDVGFGLLGIGFLYGKGFAYALNFQFYREFDDYGFLGQWTKLCLVIGYNAILDWAIGKFINRKKVNTLVCLQTLLKETRILLYLPLGYVAVLHMYVVYGFAYHHILNFVAGGLLLYVWLEEVKERKIGFDIWYRIEAILSNSKWVFLGLFLMYRLNKNFRYIRFSDHYLKELTADLLNYGFWILFLGLTVSAVVFFAYKLFYIECILTQKQSQTKHEEQKIKMKRANIYHCLYAFIIIWLVIYKTAEICESKMDSPYTFNFLAFTKVLLGLYMLCGTFVRLSLTSQMFSIYGMLLGCFSMLPILYFLSGEEFQRWFDWRAQIKELSQTLIIIVFVVVEQFRNSEKKYQSQFLQQTNKMKFEVISTLDDYERKTEIQMTQL